MLRNRAGTTVTWVLAALVLGPAACGPVTATRTASPLALDGKALPISSSCVRSAERSCQDSLGRELSDSVTCNAPGPQGPEVLVTLQYPEQFAISAGGVVWQRGKSDTPSASGGVRDFVANRGADVNVTLDDGLQHDSHHLTGSVRCG